MAAACLASCSKGSDWYDSIGGRDEASAPGEGNNDISAQPGILTAGEWNDLHNWDFWQGLMIGAKYSNYPKDWGFYTDGRIYVEVCTEDGEAFTNVTVELYSDNKCLWSAKTDNRGKAECWLNLYNEYESRYTAPENLRLEVDHSVVDREVNVTYLQDEKVAVNRIVLPKSMLTDENEVDIAFIVDATGSMADEINFLKSDLLDILGKVKNYDSRLKIRTAAVMYRDNGDEYIIRHQGFREDPNETAKFIEEQRASGGGDYPEAVHTALEAGIQSLEWTRYPKANMAFLICDAPAHDDSEVIKSLHRSIKEYAKQGIAIIPVAASGVDKETEFLLRSFAIATNGTYVFLTNDSGIGGEHIEPTVGEYQVELLNDLLTRIIQERID